MKSYQKLLLANQAWVKERLELRPDFFSRNSDSQEPEFLWIGCADSRVPAEEITGAEPGELFVHRNIANIIVHTDFNVLSVIQYAVDVLKVKHIIVCGHYGCGGIRNALSNKNLGLINKWLRHIKDVYHQNEKALNEITDENLKWDRLVEFNVKEQVQHVAETSYVQLAWQSENRPTIHGWVYDLRTGLLKDLVKIEPNSKLPDIYRFDFS